MHAPDLERALETLASVLARNGQPALAWTVRQTLQRDRPSESENQKKSA